MSYVWTIQEYRVFCYEPNIHIQASSWRIEMLFRCYKRFRCIVCFLIQVFDIIQTCWMAQRFGHVSMTKLDQYSLIHMCMLTCECSRVNEWVVTFRRARRTCLNDSAIKDIAHLTWHIFAYAHTHTHTPLPPLPHKHTRARAHTHSSYHWDTQYTSSHVLETCDVTYTRLCVWICLNEMTWHKRVYVTSYVLRTWLDVYWVSQWYPYTRTWSILV